MIGLRSALTARLRKPLGGSPTPTPTPGPSFTTQPSITSDGTPQVGETLTGNDGTIANGSVSTRQWLLNGTAISGANGTTYVPTQTGDHAYRVTATGAGGSATATSAAVTVAAAGTSWTFPTVFTDGRMPVSLVQTQASPSYTSTYNQATFDNTGTMYYVATTGSDANDGLSAGAAKRTIQSAIDAAPTGSRINVGAGRFAPFTVASKNLSIYGVAGSTFVGDLLTNADVTSWGTPASGRQAVTLASGAVSGFVDLTKTRRTDRQGNPIPQVSQVAATAAGIATIQARTSGTIDRDVFGTAVGTADPQAAVFRSTPSQLGASDGRDLTNKFDTELLAWRDTAAAPFVVSGTTQVFFKGLTFVGGAQAGNRNTTRVVMDTCRYLGAVTEGFASDGVSVLYRCVVRSGAIGGADGIDYASGNFGNAGGANGVEVDCYVDQVGATGADNCSTAHNGTVLRINGTYLDASRCWSDITDAIVGGFGCIVGGAPAAGAYSINVDSCEGHFAGITFVGSPGYDLRVANTDASTRNSNAHFYDTSYVGRSVDLTVGSYKAPIDRSGNQDTTDAALFTLDPSNIGTLFQDAAGTVPVTTAGQTVARINSVESAARYVVVTGGVYQLDAGKPCVVMTAGKFVMNVTTALFGEQNNLVYGMKSTDTSGVLYQTSGTNTVGNYAGTSSSLTGAGNQSLGKQAFAPTGLTYTVDGAGNYTTAGPFKTAGFNGSPHVLTVRNVNFSWQGWHRAQLVMSGFDGTFYGLEISRATNAANLRAREQAMATKAGATLIPA